MSTTVSVHLKAALTIKESAEHNNISINKIDSMLYMPTVHLVFILARKIGKVQRI